MWDELKVSLQVTEFNLKEPSLTQSLLGRLKLSGLHSDSSRISSATQEHLCFSQDPRLCVRSSAEPLPVNGQLPLK